MLISARGLNRASLGRQMLLQRERVGPEEAVRRVVALQAQEPASPYIALWNRVEEFDRDAFHATFISRLVVKATLMRITLHAVHADDYASFRTAMEPTLQAARLHDRRFTATGLTPEEVRTLIPGLLSLGAEPVPATRYREWLEERLGTTERARWAWWGLRGYAPLLHAPSDVPWSFDSRKAYVAAHSLPSLADPEATLAELQNVIRRYLGAFGPASVADIAQFALLYRPPLRKALAEMDDLVRLEGPDGKELYDIPHGYLPPEDTPAPPRLMAMWDSILLAHADRSRVIPPAYRSLVIRSNGDVLPTVLVDGYVAGVWRLLAGGIEVTSFHPLPEEVWDVLTIESHALRGFVTPRDPAVYRRYDRWWTTLPEAEVRTLVGA